MPNPIDQSWRDWIALNLARGCDKGEIIQILFDHKFESKNIIAELSQLPDSRNLIEIVNQKIIDSQSQELAISTLEQSREVENARLIDSIQLPFAKKLSTEKVNIYLVENFLNASECESLIALIRNRCQPSTITNPDEPDKVFRTSQTCDLGLLVDEPIVQEIDRRISEYMGLETERGETIQGQYYQVGQQFKTHTDYFEPNTPEYQKFASVLGQRTWTFMIYLNAVPLGGETNFPFLGIEIKPEIGKAVVWNSIHASGEVNSATAHWAKPVASGEKFVITKWFRTYGNLQANYEVPARKKIPIFSTEGFRKLTIPQELFVELQAFYQLRKPYEVFEQSDAIGTYIKSDSTQFPSIMVELSDTMRARILWFLTPLLEEWVKLPLEPSYVYGIREYKKGATLGMHVDRVETHQVSAILNIAQNVNTDWPLQIYDHMGRLHQVIMKPGEMLFYESARLPHGRTVPLDGDCFANIFTHTHPA